MATYDQWRKAAEQGKARRVTWVCGPEDVLAREVADRFCQFALDGFCLFGGGSPAASKQVLTAGEDAENDIWDACYSVPAAGERSLVLVREAQRLAHMANVSRLADRQLKDVWVLFVSAEDGYDRKLPKEQGGGREMFPGPAAVQALSCGQVVKCVINEQGKLSWLQRHIPGLQANPAWAVLTAAGQDMTVLADVAYKAAAARWPISEAALLTLVRERKSVADFEDDLICHRKREALSHLPGPGDFGRVFALLNSRLDVLATLYRFRGATSRELEMDARVPRMFVAAYRQAALQYTPRKVQACRRLLATLDTAWRHGARTGLGEALVAMW